MSQKKDCFNVFDVNFKHEKRKHQVHTYHYISELLSEYPTRPINRFTLHMFTSQLEQAAQPVSILIAHLLK